MAQKCDDDHEGETPMAASTSFMLRITVNSDTPVGVYLLAMAPRHRAAFVREALAYYCFASAQPGDLAKPLRANTHSAKGKACRGDRLRLGGQDAREAPLHLEGVRPPAQTDRLGSPDRGKSASTSREEVLASLSRAPKQLSVGPEESVNPFHVLAGDIAPIDFGRLLDPDLL